MSAEQNAALVRRYFEECVSGASGPEQHRALAILDELLTDDFVMFYNSDTDAEAAHGRERHKEFLIEHAQAYPDDHWFIDAIVVDEKNAACQWRIQATYARTGNPDRRACRGLLSGARRTTGRTAPVSRLHEPAPSNATAAKR